MDPNETLKRLREIVKRWHTDGDPNAILDEFEEAVEQFTALDEWLSNGGMPPKDWGMWE